MKYLSCLSLLFLSLAVTAALAAVDNSHPDEGEPASDGWDSPHTGNPILPGYYADPSLLEYDGHYFVYVTMDPWGSRTLGCWQSKDFKHWVFRELAWPTKEACTSPTSKSAMVWAPSVVRAPDGRFRMYLSVGSEVWTGVAPHPLGPWRDANGGKPLIPATWNEAYHMIDAEAFVDDDGSAYLYWGSGWNWRNGRCFAVKLKPDMINFDGEPRDVTPTNYFEAPFMFRHAGRYYLSYSNGKTVTNTYQVHYAVGDTPLGPFTEAPNSPILVTDEYRQVVSPGHHAMFSRDGRAYILYHRHRVPYVPDTAYRQTCVDEFRFNAGGLIEPVVPTHVGPKFARRESADRLAATAMASSELGPLHSASRALDDNYATRWAFAVDARGGWLKLDLGRVAAIARIELRFEYAWRPYRFVVESSTDGSSWAPLAGSDYRTVPSSGSPVSLSAATNARLVRVTFPPETPADAMSLWEVSIIPQSPASP